MNVKQQFADEGLEVSRHEYDDDVILAVDFGPVGEASVDVVGDTVIVVADGEQYDVEIGKDAQAFMKNGVLTIEVER